MKAMLDWIDQRTGLLGCLRECADSPTPAGARWTNVWPCCIAFTFVVQVMTGLVLWMYYSPSSQTAWESVYYLQYQVCGGWMLRAIHHYAAQVMLVLVGIYLVQMVISGAYRAPREIVFWLAALMGMIVLALLLTGDLLAWDQNSYTSTLIRTNFLLMLPWIGDDLFKLVAGGPEFGHLTLTRFFALHGGAFTGLFLLLLVLHSRLVRRALDGSDCDARKPAPACTRPWWPSQALRSGVACLLVMIVVLLLACQHGTSLPRAGVELGSPADAADSYAAARPEWAFRGLYEFSRMFPGELAILPIFVIPALIVAVVFLMPFIGRPRCGHWLNVSFTAILLVGLAVLTYRSYATDYGDTDFREALAAGRQRAARAVELAQAPQGIPLGGALALLRDDPKTQGPLLFEANCLSCHNHADPLKNDKSCMSMKTNDPSAPNLYAFASRRWITGLLDPKRIDSPEYFGNTAFKKGDMVTTCVKGSLAELEDEDEAELVNVIIALSAEAGLKSQREMDAKDSEIIAEASDWLDLYTCLNCHKFHDNRGSAPDLTGYGSREWLIGIIGNPAHKRFYGKNNDRMPSYAGTPPDVEKNRLLSNRQIGLLADWLRGQWYKAE